MPLYVFKCDDCGEIKERELTWREACCWKEECPYCGETLKRTIALTNFILKGNGWAKDGYR